MAMTEIGTYLRNIWSSDTELRAVLGHFEKLATEEIAAGVAQLQVAVTELGRIATAAYSEPNISNKLKNNGASYLPYNNVTASSPYDCRQGFGI